ASVADQAKHHEKITVLTHTVLEEVSGENGLTYARYKNTATGEVTEYRSEESFGVFVFAGYAPATETVQGIVERNEQGYIITDAAQKTSAEGVYAAGDVCIKPLRQVVTATSDGALAATELEKYVAAVHRKTGLRADAPVPKQSKPSVTVNTHERARSDDLFTAEMRQQLDSVFHRMERPLLLKLYLDGRPISAELENFITSLAKLSDKIEHEVCDRQTDAAVAPCVEVCQADGTPTGLAFHGVPGGHEFTSFVLGLYNAAGPGQPLEEAIRQQIAAIPNQTELKLLVTLSCTMCPDLVLAAQRIAAENPKVTAHVYDLRHFEKLKDQYRVMSVPCMIVNDDKVLFGKKNISQILDALGQ
ncbi:MAG: thioredoxin family protein, partial [Clostridia bacterium]|nr:thioredoxin family protein [Clostridia bacterium]